MEMWRDLLTNFGLATMILIAIGSAAWVSMRWLAAEIVIPLRNRLFEFIDRVDATVTALDRNVEKMSVNLERHSEALKDLHIRVCAMSAAIEELRHRKTSILSRPNRNTEESGQ